jgi:2-polyprenyl-3-methyl-5-hydroxy-6-metoxy-1,4-benzoquinol methylase
MSDDVLMRLDQLRTRAVAATRHAVARSRRQTRDPNFVGFDKYRRQGAYHWAELSRSEEYSGKAELIEGYVQANDACLDLGCGDGAYVYRMAQRARSVVGIDADFDAIRLANDQLKKHGVLNARCEQMPLSRVSRDALSVAEGFDVIYSMDVIEHLPDPTELLTAASALVRPGGTIVIGTPLYIRDELVSPYHVKEFTREEISTLVKAQLPLTEELLIPNKRLDGKTYDATFYVSVSRMP